MNKILVGILSICFCFTGISLPSIANANWSIMDLGDLGGSIGSSATSVNDSGQVVGWSDISGSHISHAYITGANGTDITDLGSLILSHTTAYAINNSGQVVGDYMTTDYMTADGSSRAFITSANCLSMADLGTMNGIGSTALDINDSGQVVGFINF